MHLQLRPLCQLAEIYDAIDKLGLLAYSPFCDMISRDHRGQFGSVREEVYGSVQVSAGEDPAIGKLAEKLHGYTFLDERAGRMRVASLKFGDITLGEVLSNGYDATTETSQITVFLPMLGRINLQSNRIEYQTSRADAVLVQPGMRRSRVRTDRDGRFLMMGAIVPPPTGWSRKSARLPAVLGVGDTPEVRSLRGFMRYAFTEGHAAHSAIFRPRGLEAASALVTDLVHAIYDRVLPTCTVIPCSSRVSAAENYMREHAEDPLTIAEIAHQVGVGPRALQAAFRASHGATPRQVLTEIRLEKARALLLAPEVAMTVTDAALASGFAHLGRFAAVYRQRYGECPSDTLKRVLT